MKLIVSLLAGVFILTAGSATASELTILDCNGEVKALESVDGSSLSSVEVAIENPTTDSLVLSSSTGFELKAPINNENSIINSVTPDTWTICNSDKQFVAFAVTRISQGTAVSGTQVTNAVLGGSAVAAVSAAAFIFGNSSSNDKGSSLNNGLDGSLAEDGADAPAVAEPAVDFDDSDFPLGSPAAPLEPYTPLSPFK
ncbi:MAG: hypothetical protein R3A13_10250 [Bdellovibrionota bacterium]